LVGYPAVRTFRRNVLPFWHNSRAFQTDRQTESLGLSQNLYLIHLLKAHRKEHNNKTKLAKH